MRPELTRPPPRRDSERGSERVGPSALFSSALLKVKIGRRHSDLMVSGDGCHALHLLHCRQILMRHASGNDANLLQDRSDRHAAGTQPVGHPVEIANVAVIDDHADVQAGAHRSTGGRLRLTGIIVRGYAARPSLRGEAEPRTHVDGRREQPLPLVHERRPQFATAESGTGDVYLPATLGERTRGENVRTVCRRTHKPEAALLSPGIVARGGNDQRPLKALDRYHLQHCDLGPVIGAAGAATAIDPLRESAQLILAGGHLAANNPASALHACRKFRHSLANELGVEPSPQFGELLGKDLLANDLLASDRFGSDRFGTGHPGTALFAETWSGALAEARPGTVDAPEGSANSEQPLPEGCYTA